MNVDAPFITVALCTHNHADRLARTLPGLAQLERPASPWELLIVDNASTDATAEVLATPDWRPPGVDVRIVRELKLGLSNARNCAIQEARGEYILFMDDDETPDSAWIRSYEAAMREYRPDALGGRIEVLFEDGARPSWLQDELLGFLGKLDHGEARWLTEESTPIFGGNFAFRRDVFERIGNFDTGLGRLGTVNAGGEDTDIHSRLLQYKCTVRWVPQSIIYHRIQAPKLRRRYFIDLHYRFGRIEGARSRSTEKRFPPLYVYAQLARAASRALLKRVSSGSDYSLRLEMNAGYFAGYILGWLQD